MWESIVDRLEANENDIVRIAVTGVAGDAAVIVIVVINYVVVCVQQRTVIVVTIFKFGAYIFLLIRAIVHISFRTNGHILQGAEFLVAMICDNIRSVVRIIRGAVPRIGDALTKSNILVDSINIIKSHVDANAGNRQAAYGAIINGSLGTVRIRMVLVAAIVAERGGGDLGDRLRLSALLNFVLDYVLRQIAGVIIQSGDLLGEYRGAGSGLGRVIVEISAGTTIGAASATSTVAARFLAETNTGIAKVRTSISAISSARMEMIFFMIVSLSFFEHDVLEVDNCYVNVLN